MRVAIASRIFDPEPSAASFRLAALADAFEGAGHEVEVLTVFSAAQLRGEDRRVDSTRPYRIRRFPVLRNRSGYVRGYVQYMTFDIPLFFRLLLGRRRDLVVIEPPPTTGFFARLATGLRRTAYVYYAADVWSDAAESTGAGAVVVKAVREMERFSLTGARAVFAVNAGVTERVRQIAPRARVSTVGNGVDVKTFSVDGAHAGIDPTLIYSGTASEWQGASVFIDAFASVMHAHPAARLLFLGQGSDWAALEARARKAAPGRVDFVPTVPAETAAARMRGAVASLASIRPDSGYGFAFPTKVFASWACGTPVVFAGPGPVRDFMVARAKEAPLGEACDFDLVEVAAAMDRALSAPLPEVDRRRLGSWAVDNVSLHAVAQRVLRVVEATG